jgi:hypothetical protein
MTAWSVRDISFDSPVRASQSGTDIETYYLNYGGWSYAPSFGAYGAIIVFGGGHTTNISPQVFAFDIESLQFVRVADEPPRPWTWANDGEAELGDNLPGASYSEDGWSYRFSSPDVSKWQHDYRRKAVTYGELAHVRDAQGNVISQVPMQGHAYSANTCLPAGVLGGGPKGSLIVPLHSSQHFSTGIFSYYGHQLDLATGRWRRMADEIGPETYYDPAMTGDFAWIFNQPSASTTEYANGRLYLRCRFDANNRALAVMNVAGAAGSESWSIIPGEGTVDNGGQGPGCLVTDSGWWVDYVPGTGQLLLANVNHDETSRHTWIEARLSGDPLPRTVVTPAMQYIASQRRIVLFTSGEDWPLNTLIEIQVPADITDTWVITHHVLNFAAGTPSIRPASVETWRKLIVCESAGALLWYAGWETGGAVQAIKPSWWV